MQSARLVLTPDALAMLSTIAQEGSFARAARVLGVVPSALTYRVRQMEDALDVLLFDRSSRQARVTAAGKELLREGERLLADIDAVANRVKRVATGWETQLTIAVDSIIAKGTVFELCEAFYATQAPTRIKLLDETLSGTLEALTLGRADLALGVADATTHLNVHTRPMGEVRFIYVVAPHHPLAQATEPLDDEQIQKHRAVAVADTITRGAALTFGLLGGQDVLTVATMKDKLDAQLRNLGGGFVPEGMARPYLESGRLVHKEVARTQRFVRIHYAWRQDAKPDQGRALAWWLEKLSHAETRTALLEQHRGPG